MTAQNGSMSRLKLPGTEEAPVYAVAGPTASTVAYNLSGMLAEVAREEGARVLLVDAEGYVSRQILPPIARAPVDDLLSGGNRGDVNLEDYLIHDTNSGLSALLYPQQTELRATEIIHRLRAEFDAVVVSCGDSAYAADWLLDADQAVVSGAGARGLLETLRRVDRLRERGNTLLAPMDDLQLPQELDGREVFRLPSPQRQTFEQAERNGQFATLTDPVINRSFEPLLTRLLGSPAAQTGENSPVSSTGHAGSSSAVETPGEHSTQVPADVSTTESGGPRAADEQPTDRLSTEDVIQNMRLNAQLLNSETGQEPAAPKESDHTGLHGKLSLLFKKILKKQYLLYGLGIVLVLALLLFLAGRWLSGGENSARNGGSVADTGVTVRSQVDNGKIQLTTANQVWEGEVRTSGDGEKVTTLEGPTAAQFKEGFELPGGGSVTTGVFAAARPGEPTVHATFHRVNEEEDEETSGSYYAIQDGEVTLEGSYVDHRDGNEVIRTYTEGVPDGQNRSFKVRFEAPPGVPVPQLIGWKIAGEAG